MADIDRRAWEQQEGEPNTAYARFLFYLHCPRPRSVEKAYKAYLEGKGQERTEKDKKHNGTWANDCARWSWVERAAAWDVEQIAAMGVSTVVHLIDGLRVVAEKSLDKLKNTDPLTWQEALQALNVVGSYIPAETVAAIRNTARNAEPPAIGASNGTNAGDYRPLLAHVAPRSNDDSGASSKDEGNHNGAAVGEVNAGGGVDNA